MVLKRVFFSAYRYSKEIFFIILGVLIAGFGLEGFLIPNGFIDGGVTGISLLISFLTPVPLSLLIFIINVPFIFLAKKQIGKIFAIKTLFAIIGLALCLIFVHYPIITSDKLLVSVFGGFLIGAGIGLSVRGGGVLDGTEILSVYLSRRIGLTMGEIVFVINIIIFSIAALFLSIETALYSILIYLFASKTVDFIVQGIEEYTGLTIISEKSEQIRKKLIQELGKGVTVYNGKRGFSRPNQDNNLEIIFTAVTRLEALKIKNQISEIDPHAVIIEHTINEVKGGLIKKRPSLD